MMLFVVTVVCIWADETGRLLLIRLNLLMASFVVCRARVAFVVLPLNWNLRLTIMRWVLSCPTSMDVMKLLVATVVRLVLNLRILMSLILSLVTSLIWWVRLYNWVGVVRGCSILSGPGLNAMMIDLRLS